MKFLLLLVSITAFAQFQTPFVVKPPPAGTNGAAIRLMNRSGFYTGFRADGSMASNNEYQMPVDDGTAGQVLATNGGKLLSWTSVAGNTVPVCASSDLTDAYSCTIAGLTSYSPNYCVIFSVATSNTGTATLDINGIGVVSILRYGGSSLVTNDILAASPLLLCHDGTQFTLPPSASPGSGAFLDGGNTFGAAATLGTNDGHNLIFERNNVPLVELSDVGLNIAPSGLANFFTRVTKLDIGDIAGAGGEYDFQVSASFVSNSSIKLRDNGGGRVFQADRAVAGTRVNNFGLFASLIPRKRDTGDGDDVTDTDFPNLGGPTAPWEKAYIAKLYADTIEQSIYPAPTNTIQLGGVSNYFSNIFTVELNSNDVIVTNSGPVLGAGQNISPVWVTGGSGFVGLGFWRTDDTDGGWLMGTSGVAVGDFAIYQNQGAGIPTRRLSINPSGDVDFPGSITATGLTINTGSATIGYAWKATSTGGAGAWQPEGLDQYDVRNYGAVCDAVTDDTTSIQAAITAAVGIKGIVILPQGTCLVSTLNITSSFRGIRGQGVNVTRLKSATNAPIILIDTGTGTPLDFYNLEFSYMTIIGDGTSSNQYGFEVKGEGSFNNSDFHHLWFEDLQISFYAHLDGVTGSGHNKFHENWFSLGNTNAIGIYRYAPEGSGWMISGNDFGGAAGSIGDTSGPRAVVMRKFMGDLMINDNHMEGGWIALDLSCDDGLLPKTISAATAANPAVLTATAHGRTGSILISINGFTGAWAVVNGEWTATVTGANTLSIPVDTTALGAISGSPEITSSGSCAYGANVVATGNKTDGYSLDGRLFNVVNSLFTGNRGRGFLREQIRGAKTALSYDLLGYTDTGSAINRTGIEFTTAIGNLSLNGYDEGRIRIGDTSTNLSGTRNGISILDTVSNGLAIGQSSTRHGGFQWVYSATAANAYAILYTVNQANPMYYAAAGHTFQGGIVNVLNSGSADTNAVAAFNQTVGSYGSCFSMHSTDSASSSIYAAGRLCGKYETASFTDELISIQTFNGSSYDTAQTWKGSNSTIRGNLGLGTGATALAPAYQLSFGQTLTNKLLALYADPSNWFGLGMDSSTLRIETGSSGDAKFYSGGTLKAAFGTGGSVLGANLNFTSDNTFDIGNSNRPRDITASRTITGERFYSIYGINPVTSGFGSVGDSTHIWEGNYFGTTTFSGNISFGSGVAVGGSGARALHVHTDSMSVYSNGFVKSGANFNFQSGASVTSNGNSGVSVSGATCTVTRIDYGVVTGATCP